MKILLVQPPYNSQTVGGNNFYIPEPLALETVGANVTHHNVKLLDMRLDPNLSDTLAQFQPDIVGTTSYTPEVYRAQKILKQVKDFNPETLTVIGGHHATLLPEDFNKEYIDIVVIGEGDITFRELADAYEKKGDLTKVNGLIIRQKDSKILFTQPREMVSNLDFAPIPKRSLTENYREKYFRLIWRPVASMMTSRGCPFRCNFCSIWKHEHGKYRARSAESVMKELLTINEKYVSISDDNFLQDSERLEKLYHLIKQSGIKKSYKIITRSDSVVRNALLIEQWKEIGLSEVTLGLESFRDNELKALNKSNTVQKNTEAIKIVKDNGISLTGHFILNQNYMKEDFEALKDYIYKTGLNHPMFTVLTPLPMTDYYNETKSQLLTTNYEMYDLVHSVLPTKLPREKFYEYYADLYYDVYIRNNKNNSQEIEFFNNIVKNICIGIKNAYVIE
ncbi:MAG: hypothetical protein A2474_05875 [Elusimicrobia bacterium RIFOXYC2_FULL_34_12]|nr:MAG: hypothetical protein A2474_05875 [Elusimicrobia bacterium RIFOXYC2_FULL_34_12]OGS39661.1 MAG: hypothetical protein A2551_07955 [Elusimicrobia bacterium RIFOXYD2_FULL_34_30]HAM38992.1 B12-binding domain-containing radical SAM protein [Elusimicrobiota bacterium]